MRALEGVGRGLVVSTRVVTTNGQGIVVARQMSFTCSGSGGSSTDSHVALGALGLPWALAPWWLRLNRIDARHRGLARWVWPLWMYVSISGVVVYLLLYQVYA
mgnify:CR=1 FL=1